MMDRTLSAEQVKAALEAAVSGCRVEILQNGSPSAQHSLVIDNEHALEAARFLREDAGLRLDFCSNVTGVDWLEAEVSERVKTRKLVDGAETEVEEVKKTKIPGRLEAVYHLFSMEKKHGPVVVRLRTENRTDRTRVPSLTPVWRSAEFQEREVFDLYGIVFEGHPDLRRILMWDEFTDHPMRRDYVAPADDDEPVAASGEVAQ
jgi:NADH-quinone oxidoreductase subunit C